MNIPAAVPLSPRELQVLALITAGSCNSEIAAEMGLELSSTKSYVRSAYRKIGVSTRVQAVRWGCQNGLLPLLPPHSAHDGARVLPPH